MTHTSTMSRNSPAPRFNVFAQLPMCTKAADVKGCSAQILTVVDNALQR